MGVTSLKLSGEVAPGRKNIYLVLTHHHTDHIFGMRAFKERGAKVIGHRELKEWIANFWLEPGLPLPKIYKERVLSDAEPSEESRPSPSSKARRVRLHSPAP